MLVTSYFHGLRPGEDLRLRRGPEMELSESTEHETVWVPRQFLASERVRSYHWDDDCARAPESDELVEVPYGAVLSSPRLKPCPACAPRA
jgi:hypothetical protein